MKITIYILLFFFATNLFAQEIILPPDTIKTIQLNSSIKGVFTPIIPLNGSLHLSFDDLEADEKDYYYQIEHCDMNWETSDLVTTEFVNGYAEERIKDYENSFNTLQDYTHYELRIPNKNTRLLISGNYRISILNDDYETVFTRYFVVYESLATVGVSVHRSRDVSYIDSQQSIQFSINHPGLHINNPRDEIKPVILQNNDFSTQIVGLKPQFIRGNQLLYKYDKETAFWGGNEFLHFDTKEIRTTNLNIAKIISGENLYHTLLYTNIVRKHDPYTYYPDINGGFVIRNLNAETQETESDYSWVHFSLKVYEPFQKKEVYIYGTFNNYQLAEENRMIYNSKTGTYDASILCKQGFYNYKYVTLDEDNTINSTTVSGSFDETENDYLVLVYYSKFGSYYDRVIGVGRGNSKNLSQ
ncbi:MAG TPA: DUF5103 domain-containing protein [Lutibacter sp.]|nr:DUF5103 domain-containing protein [Lutibacter sp.]